MGTFLLQLQNFGSFGKKKYIQLRNVFTISLVHSLQFEWTLFTTAKDIFLITVIIVDLWIQFFQKDMLSLVLNIKKLKLYIV